tara:strand:+ start:81 stop:1586 length:1506 start_codon:yes stop_codon:yes gene_type:complete
MPKTCYHQPVDHQTASSSYATDDTGAHAILAPEQLNASRPAASMAQTPSQIAYEHTPQATVAAFEAYDRRQQGPIYPKKPALWRYFAWFFYPFQLVFRYANQLRMHVFLLVCYMFLAGYATIRRFWDTAYYAMHRMPLYKHIKKRVSSAITPRMRLMLLQTLWRVWILFDRSTTAVIIIFTTQSKYAKYMLRCMLYPLRRIAQYRMLLMFLVPNVRIFCLFLQITMPLFTINSVRNIHAHTWHVSLYRYHKTHGLWPSLIDFISKITHSAWLFFLITPTAGSSVPIAIFGTCMIYGYTRWLFTQKEVYVSLLASAPVQAKLLPLHESAPRVTLPRGYFIMKKQLIEPDNHHKPASMQKKLALYFLCQNFERYVSATYKNRYDVDLSMDDISLFLPICHAIQRNETSQSDTPVQGDFHELQHLEQGKQQASSKKQPKNTKSSTSNDKTLLVNHSLNQKVSKLMHELWPIWHGKNAHVLRQFGIKRMKYPRVQDVLCHALRVI